MKISAVASLHHSGLHQGTAMPANAPASIFAASEKFGGRDSYLQRQFCSQLNDEMLYDALLVCLFFLHKVLVRSHQTVPRKQNERYRCLSNKST